MNDSQNSPSRGSRRPPRPRRKPTPRTSGVQLRPSTQNPFESDASRVQKPIEDTSSQAPIQESLSPQPEARPEARPEAQAPAAAPVAQSRAPKKRIPRPGKKGEEPDFPRPADAGELGDVLKRGAIPDEPDEPQVNESLEPTGAAASPVGSADDAASANQEAPQGQAEIPFQAELPMDESEQSAREPEPAPQLEESSAPVEDPLTEPNRQRNSRRIPYGATKPSGVEEDQEDDLSDQEAQVSTLRRSSQRMRAERSEVVGGVSVRQFSEASRNEPFVDTPFAAPVAAASLPEEEPPALQEAEEEAPQGTPAQKEWRAQDQDWEPNPERVPRSATSAAQRERVASISQMLPDPEAVSNIETIDPFDQPFDEFPEQDSGYDYGQFGYVQEGSGYASADPISHKRGRGKRILRNLGIAVAILLVVGLGAWWMWEHRGIEVVVNGSRTTAQIDATINDLFDASRWKVVPGNLVSVSGNLIAEGGGELYTATLDGVSYNPGDAATVKVKAGDQITFGQGADTMEEYDPEFTPIEPKLLMNGDGGSVAFISQWGRSGQAEVRHGRQSGETAPGPGTPVQDCVVTVLSPQPRDGQKLIALTFDDGPSSYTSEILDILAEYGVKATFFNVGEYVEVNPDLSRRIVQNGHQLCSNTMSRADLTASSSETVLQEVTDGFAAIAAATGIETTTFRPPYGNFRQTTWLETQGRVSTSVLWDVTLKNDTNPSSAELTSGILGNAHNGGIVLMYDGGGDRTAYVEALPDIIEGLQDDGYKLVTVSELLASDDRVPAEIITGSAKMPADAVWPSEIG